MADAGLSALVKVVLGKLGDLAIEEFGLLWGFKDDVLGLKRDFEQIKAVLEDAEKKHDKEKAVELWLKSISSASFEVENVLDEISTEALLQRLYKKRGIKKRVSAFFSSNQLVFRLLIAHKVKELKKKLDAIAHKRFELNLADSSVEGEIPNRETISPIRDSSRIFGREEEIKMIIKTICNKEIGKNDNGEIRVYGIWGMGGLGKTTLAQLVYNNETVKNYFELKCWIYVSKKFQVQEIVKKLIESIDNSASCSLTQLETSQEYLQSKLKQKKFLIVLDDVWIEYGEKKDWDQLSEILSSGAEGSIVVTTTRSQTTSQMMAKFRELQHKPCCLSEHDSWLLFEKLAFAQGREEGDMSELKPIGREIVKKCKGLPLAIKTLGGVLFSKSGKNYWQSVKDSNMWELDEFKVLPAILKLSYDNLLPHLKRCFAYCCLFPKGFEMEKDVVIRMWMSNGFIPARGGTDLYVLGEESFDRLVRGSFFEVFKAKIYGYETFKMHDMMHDMAQHVMRHDCLVIEPDKEVIIPNEVLHLSSSCPDYLFPPQDLSKLTSLRSILMLGKINASHVSQIVNNVYLRVLYLPRLRALPESIRKLKFLKYLNLSHSMIKVLPESIIYLQNLEVLLLHSCQQLYELPNGLRYMRNLQCLGINSCYSLPHLPLGIKELTNLRILSPFLLGNKRGAKIEELGNLNLLEGKLEITRLENVGDLSEAKNANLKRKRNVYVLMLSWSNTHTMESNELMCAYDEKILEELEPNPSLKELRIACYMGKIISPSWMVNLGHLIEIMFFGCKKCEHIPSLGRLPNLRVIKLEYMDSLKCFHDADTNMLENTTASFVHLQELDISFCPNLISLPGNLPKLKILRLYECHELVSLPNEIQSFKDLTELEISECKHLSKRCEKEIGVDWPKISHIPNILRGK